MHVKSRNPNLGVTFAYVCSISGSANLYANRCKNILQPILKSDPLQAFIGQQINMLQQLRQKPMQ